MEKITLFTEKSQCCACGACLNICPKNAIKMQNDEYGFPYPIIDEDKCIKCGACKKVCAFQHTEEKNIPKEVYAASREDNEKIRKSASGGIFAVFAEYVLSHEGVVFGAAMRYKEGRLVPEHIEVKEIEQLDEILGSKYIQSSIGTTYKLSKKYLNEGKLVLFSGTPCQIAGLKSFLGKEYENLLTIDIICHGVPSADLFKGYITYLEHKFGQSIIDFKFRDKCKGTGYNAKIVLKDKNGNITSKYISCKDSSYYSLFLKSESCRENCYCCKYANIHRVGDITIGDYWGIQEEHPESLIQNGGSLDEKRGISVIIVNTNNGVKWLQKCKNKLIVYPSDVKKVAKKNTQLRKPSSYGKHRDRILNIYKEVGYEAVEKYYKKFLIFYKLRSKVKSLILVSAKRIIKNMR